MANSNQKLGKSTMHYTYNICKCVDFLYFSLFVWHYARSSDTRYVDKWEFSDSTCCRFHCIFLMRLTKSCTFMNIS